MSDAKLVVLEREPEGTPVEVVAFLEEALRQARGGNVGWLAMSYGRHDQDIPVMGFRGTLGSPRNAMDAMFACQALVKGLGDMHVRFGG